MEQRTGERLNGPILALIYNAFHPGQSELGTPKRKSLLFARYGIGMSQVTDSTLEAIINPAVCSDFTGKDLICFDA